MSTSSAPNPSERYPGEFVTLRSFIEELADILPADHLLSRMANRALRTGTLEALRGATRAYRMYPPAFRGDVVRRIFSGGVVGHG